MMPMYSNGSVLGLSKGEIEEGIGEIVCLVISEDDGGPIDLCVDDRPNLAELTRTRSNEAESVDKVGDVGTHGVNKELAGDECRGLRVWTADSTVHHVWDVFFGRDG